MNEYVINEDEIKVIKDPIYGYIEIPVEYFLFFIDTSIFQRLRRIEQTGARVLYPAAHHDRFVHSLGVFHLGKLAFQNLKRNSFNLLNETQWKKYQKTFEIACLLHDCGHAPFSHTFEEYFVLGSKISEIKTRFLKFFDENFLIELNESGAVPHEKISALIVLEVYGEAIKKVGADALLAARMILGCKHIKETISHSEDFENKLISLLNGAGLDVDSLDYIQRDTWSSGFTNVNIDYARLLSGISITYNGSTYKIVFNKSALNVLENIWLGRNYLYKWIYTHHKVIYEQYLLKSVVEELDVESKSEFINNIFNIQRFSEPYKMQFNGIRYYLPTDDDIITSIKQSEIKNKKAELLSRQYRFKSLWKTYFEFSEYFRDYSSIDSNDLMKEVIILLDSLNYRDSQDYIILEAKPNLKELKPNEYYIKIDKKNEIDAFYASDIKVKPVKYFYLYVNNEMLKKKAEILEKLKHINLEKPLINEEQFYCKRCKMNIDCPDREDCIKVKAPHLN